MIDNSIVEPSYKRNMIRRFSLLDNDFLFNLTECRWSMIMIVCFIYMIYHL